MHINASPTQFGVRCASQRVPKAVNGYALEDGDEDAGDGEADNKMITPKEDATELDDGEDAVLEEDSTISNLSDGMTLRCVWIPKAVEAINGVTPT